MYTSVADETDEDDNDEDDIDALADSVLPSGVSYVLTREYSCLLSCVL